MMNMSSYGVSGRKYGDEKTVLYLLMKTEDHRNFTDDTCLISFVSREK